MSSARSRGLLLIGGAALSLAITCGTLSAQGRTHAVEVPRPRRPIQLVAPAVVEPSSRLVEVDAQMQGRLLWVHKEPGAPVARGEVLAQLDASIEEATVALRRAELERASAVLSRVEAGARATERDQALADLQRAGAERDRARLELDRARSLVERGVGPRQMLDRAEVDHSVADALLKAADARARELAEGARSEVVLEARADVARAEAAFLLAEAQLERTRLRSPIDGRCIYRYREPGEVVGRPIDKVPVLTIAGNGPLRLRADVDAREIARVAVGQPVEATAPAFPGRRFTGRVVEVEHIMGRKNIRTDRPREKIDTKILEVVVELEPSEDISLPLGLEVTATFLEP